MQGFEIFDPHSSRLYLASVKSKHVQHGQIHKYFVCNVLCAAHYRKKTLGGYVRGTIGFQKKSMPTPVPRPGGGITAFVFYPLFCIENNRKHRKIVDFGSFLMK